MFNKVVLIGYVSSGITIKDTPNSKVTNFSVTTSETNNQGKIYKQFHRCVAWGKVAEASGKLAEGDLVCVEGKLAHRSYDKNGQKVWVTEVNLSQVNKLSNGNKTSDEEMSLPEDTGDGIPF